VELFFREQIEEAAVVDADGRYVGMLSAADLLRWALAEDRGAAEDLSPPACPYQLEERLLAGADAVICTRAQGSCPLQELRATTGGRQTAVCRLPDGLVTDWQQASGGGPARTVRRSLTADSVGPEASLSALARAAIHARVHRLIVVNERHRPIGTVSCLDVLAALAGGRADGAGG
jgi:hypothetical protein